MVFQSRLIYFPTRYSESLAVQAAVRAGLEPWRERNGTLIGWKTIGKGDSKPQARMVVFHGNAGEALGREYLAELFLALDKEIGWQIYLFEYPGYGCRPGKPGEKAIEEAALKAFDELIGEDSRPVYLFGESIGGGPACYLAGKRSSQVAGVMLSTPFTRLSDVAAIHYPYFPVRWLLRDRYDNVKALKNFPGPVGILVAGQDEVATPQLGRELYESYQGLKKLWIQEMAGHNTVVYLTADPTWREASLFLRTSRSTH